MRSGSSTAALVQRLASYGVAALLLVGCAAEGIESDPVSSRTGDPMAPDEALTRAGGPPADAHGTLRAMEIRRLLLSEDELFVRSGGRVVDYVEVETVLHR